MSEKIIIRKILPEEYSFMEEIMCEAIYHPDPKNPYPKDIIYLPQIRVYWDNWGEGNDDHCLVAIIKNRIAGAVWIRSFQGELKGYGYIDGQTPEISIALFEEFRGKGIGTVMMKKMVALMKSQNYAQVSLSISKGNPAIHLYERLGFRTIDENEEDYIMLLKLTYPDFQ